MVKGFKDNKGKFRPTDNRQKLKQSQIKEIGNIYGDLELDLRDTRNLVSEKMERGVESLHSEKIMLRTLGRSVSAFGQLVTALPEHEARAIFDQRDKFKKEVKEFTK